MVCLMAGEKRIVRVDYQNLTPVPCHVVIQKGNDIRRPWSASSETGFCERKANDYIAEWQTNGWDCYHEITNGNNHTLLEDW